MRRTGTWVLLAGATSVLALAWAGTASAQGAPTPEQIEAAKSYKRLTGPQTLNPGDWPQHWPYPDEADSAVAASEVHHVRYVDSKVRLVEVAYFPGVHGQMHGHPFASVFAVDAPAPKATNVGLDPERRPSIGHGTAPKGMQFPTCMTMGPQAPHAETNKDTWPHHFYRLEYYRLDGSGIQQNWKTWYPRMLEAPLVRSPAKATEDGVVAAPDSNKLLYEDPHVRLVEVTLRPGETEPMHADPNPAVLAIDAVSGGPALEDRRLDPTDPLNGRDASEGAPPTGFSGPTCATIGPRAPHSLHNPGSTPAHFYRIEFKRIDGDELRTRWREWYPWLGVLTDAYAAHPYAPNY